MRKLPITTLVATVMISSFALGQGTPKTIHCAVMTDRTVDVALATNGHDYADYKGRRYFFCCGSCPGMFKENPEAYVKNDSIPTPAGIEKPYVGLTRGTIIAAYLPGSAQLPKFLREHTPAGADVIFNIKEWIPELPHSQLRYFYNMASHTFVLKAPGHPEIKLTLLDWNVSMGDGKFQGYGAHFDDGERSKLVAGVAYHLEPVQPDSNKLWREAGKIVVRWPRNK